MTITAEERAHIRERVMRDRHSEIRALLDALDAAEKNAPLVWRTRTADEIAALPDGWYWALVWTGHTGHGGREMASHLWLREEGRFISIIDGPEAYIAATDERLAADKVAIAGPIPEPVEEERT